MFDDPHPRGARLVQADTNGFETLAAVLGVDGNQHRNFLLALVTPRRPKHDQRVRVGFGRFHQVHGSAVPLVHGEVGRCFADLQVDDAFGALANDVAQVRSAVLVVDVVVKDVLADVFLSGVVEAFQHGIQRTFQGGRVGLEVSLHHVNAGQKPGVRPLAVRHHEPLDAVADGHAADQAVVHGIEVVEEVALGAGVFGVGPPEEFGDVRARIGVHHLVLLLHEVHFLVGNLLLDLSSEWAVLQLLAKSTNLVVVDSAEILVREPDLVLGALGCRFPAGQLFGSEHKVEVWLVGRHDELAVVLGVRTRHLVEAAVNLYAAKVELLALHRGAVHERQVAALGFVEVQHRAVCRGHGAVKANLPHLVAFVGVVDAVLPLGRNGHVGLRSRGCGLGLGRGGLGRGRLRGRGFSLSAAQGQQGCRA